MLARRAPEISPLEWKNDLEGPREEVLAVSRTIRGLERPPAIMLHGVMRRSGTNFIGDLIGLDPNICRYPGDVWEAPLLSASAKLLEAEETFLSGYNANREHFRPTDFLPLFGSSFLAYLHSYAPPEQRVLVKVPGVEYVWHFRFLFPGERLVILQRDGRDLVASTIKSWPKSDFSEVCELWKASQNLVLKLKERPESDGVCFVRYEDAVENPQGFVRRLFEELDVDDKDYPYDNAGDLPVRGSSALRVDGKMSWKPQSKPESFNPVGRWTQWTDEEKRTFKAICGETLIRSGYAENLDW